jgi:hypothetical protein
MPLVGLRRSFASTLLPDRRGPRAGVVSTMSAERGMAKWRRDVAGLGRRVLWAVPADGLCISEGSRPRGDCTRYGHPSSTLYAGRPASGYSSPLAASAVQARALAGSPLRYEVLTPRTALERRLAHGRAWQGSRQSSAARPGTSKKCRKCDPQISRHSPKSIIRCRGVQGPCQPFGGSPFARSHDSQGCPPRRVWCRVATMLTETSGLAGRWSPN